MKVEKKMYFLRDLAKLLQNHFYSEVCLKYKDFKSVLGSRHGFHISQRQENTRHSGRKAYSDLVVLLEFTSNSLQEV